MRYGRWHFVTSRLDQTAYERVLHLMLSHTAVVDARAEYSRSDGQGVFVTVWGRACVVCQVHEVFDSRGTQGTTPSWRLYFTLAAEQMGRQAGTVGPFVMPPPRSYAYVAPVVDEEVQKESVTPIPISSEEETVNYTTVSMDPDYVGEETGAVWGTKVQYFSAEEREAYELNVDSAGLLRNMAGDLFDTQSAGTVTGKGKAIFVMAPNGKIYASLYHQAGIFHHSSFLSGEPVSAAGEIEVIDGIVTMVSNRSGHYAPDQSYTYQFVEQLWRKGVKGTENINIVDFDH